MKLLVIHGQLPVPPLDGGRLRRLQQLEALMRDHEITLVGRCPDVIAGDVFRRDRPTLRVVTVPEHEDRGRSLVTRTVREWLDREKFDAVLVAGLSQWPGERSLGSATVVLDVENYDTDVFRHMRAVGDVRVSPFEIAATDALLSTACRRADLVTVCSEPDEAALRALAPDARIEIVPNGVEASRFEGLGAPPRRRPPVITFMGLLAYWPNADAVSFLVSGILPGIQARVGDVVVQIVGRVPPENVVALADGVTVRLDADVPDIRPFLAASEAIVVPLRAGSGTRLKILEAFAARRPVISTSIGAQGLDVQSGQHLLIADDAEAFAAGVARVLTDQALAGRLVDSAFRLVSERYDVPVVTHRLRELYQELLPA